MLRIALIISLQTVLAISSFGQKNKGQQRELVSLEIIDEQDTLGHKTISFEWSFPKGQTPVGGTKALQNKVETLLADNGVPCPPKRQKISSNIWLCGDGKKIRTSSTKLANCLHEAWDENE